MKVSKACIDLIKVSESFKAFPYRCPAGVPTIGYGSTRYTDGTKVKMTDPAISEPQAVDLMLANLDEYEAAVRRYVTVPLTQGQYDALVDFAYNAGAQNLRTSTLLRLLNAGDYAGATNQFKRWIYADGKKLNGLVTRRAAEAALFRGVA